MAYSWCFVSSVLYVQKKRAPFCYKKYLGPEWKPSYDKPSTVICNHSSWLDTPVMMTMYSPSFIAKDSVKRLPGVGYMAKLLGSLFIDRSSKDARTAMFEAIAKH